MKLVVLAELLPAIAAIAVEGDPCHQNGAWDCGGYVSNGWTQILICSYNRPGTSDLTWKVNSVCDGDTPCCDQLFVEMGGVPHCNTMPTTGEFFLERCGVI
jgi:hypothetical protein